MHLQNFLAVTLLATFLSGCLQAGERGHQSSEAAESTIPEPDTLAHSFPWDYMSTLENSDPSNKLEIRSYQDILDLFETLNYTPEAWQAGIREVPRVYLTIVGDRWGTTTSKEITVLNKKRIFFRSMAPMILRANELILEDRTRLEKIRTAFQKGEEVSETDRIFLTNLSAMYKVENNGPMTDPVLEELWEKVDMVPPSLALAQGAEESGWGTSRFAAEGNAVYGQWTWGKNAIKPEQQREQLGNYGIAAFESLQESVCAYMLNLNTHRAYQELRDKRAELRKNGKKISGSVLADQLTKYSERGEGYVKTLHLMMDSNLLEPTDDAFLSNDPPIYLIPAAE